MEMGERVAVVERETEIHATEIIRLREANAMKYPKRRELVSRGRPGIRDQVSFAQRMRERALKAMREATSELRGKDLACFCPLTAKCHADLLLEIANG